MTPLDYNGPLEEGRAFGRTSVVLPEPGEEEPEPVVEEPALESGGVEKTGGNAEQRCSQLQGPRPTGSAFGASPFDSRIRPIILLRRDLLRAAQFLW